MQKLVYNKRKFTLVATTNEELLLKYETELANANEVHTYEVSMQFFVVRQLDNFYEGISNSGMV